MLADTPDGHLRSREDTDPSIATWQGHRLRMRHGDPHLGPYSPRSVTIRAAVELASDTEGLRLALTSAMGHRYAVKVSDDGSIVGPWRR